MRCSECEAVISSLLTNFHC